MSYNPPTGPPPNWESKEQNSSAPAPQGEQSRGYGGQQQPYYQPQQGYQQGYNGPPQQGYYQGQPQGGYYQQQPQQQYYVQQKKSNNNDCLMGCLAAMCVCCTLDAIF